jgi:hypothetical protein
LHSYNGEAVAIVVAAAVSFLAFRPLSLPAALLRALLAALTAYVKAQALPIVFFLLLMRSRHLTLGRFRINERVLLLSFAAAFFLLCETVITLSAGHPFLSKLPALFRYMHTIDTQSTMALPDFAAFVSQNESTTFQFPTIAWTAETLAIYLPSVVLALVVFVALYAANKHFHFRGKTYLLIALLYVAVALLSIALPGNRFEHYVLLALPVLGVLARGFSVAGARICLPPLRLTALFLFIVLVGETGLVGNYYRFTSYASMPTSENETRAIPYDLIESLRPKVHFGNEVFVHGFDSEIYVYTRSLPPSLSLSFMMSKTRTLADFCGYALNVRKLAPMFIVDAVAGGWGYVTHKGLALETNASFKAILLDNYRLQGRYSGIPVYERINKTPRNVVDAICGRAGLTAGDIQTITR